jgi:hypothetical protein
MRRRSPRSLCRKRELNADWKLLVRCRGVPGRPAAQVTFCNCPNCRKASGTAFAANVCAKQTRSAGRGEGDAFDPLL